MDAGTLDRDIEVAPKAPAVDNTEPVENNDAVVKHAARSSKTRAIIDEFISNTTTHGVPRVLSDEYSILLRIFWSLIILTFLVLLVFQGTLLVINFIGRPSSTKLTIVTESKLEFPAVTICNLNMMRRSMLQGRLLNRQPFFTL